MKGVAVSLKASVIKSECVDAVPCDGVARYSLLAAVIDWLGLLLVQSWTAMVLAFIQPRISKTIPLGAKSANSGVVKRVACVCHSCPIRRLVGSRLFGRSGRRVDVETDCSKFLMVGDHRPV